MPTLKKIKEDRISITSKLLKKNKEFLPISPELIRDLRDKTLLESPTLKLSINDYKLMCSNNTILNMMSIALNKPKAKLKKFCKYLSVFEENIHLTPKSIANKINGPICNLAQDVRSIILDKFAEILPSKYVLLDWIDKGKLDWMSLSVNPNAIDLLEENYNEIDWNWLSINPNAIDLLKENYDKINWYELSTNPNAIDLLKKQIKYEKTLTKEQYNNLEFNEKINWYELSANPNAIHILKENPDEIDWRMLLQNSNAIELLKNNKHEIKWYWLSTNPNAIDLLKERIKYENNLTKKEFNNLKYLDKIDWGLLSSNPNAIDILKNNKDKIDWDEVCKNPNAIDLIEKRIKYENSLTTADYNKLNYYEKIGWLELSENPNAINLIKERIKYENSLTTENYKKLNYAKKINWNRLSRHPNSINILKENQDKIDWLNLSQNPSIFKVE
jgi:hypothetical protein